MVVEIQLQYQEDKAADCLILCKGSKSCRVDRTEYSDVFIVLRHKLESLALPLRRLRAQPTKYNTVCRRCRVRRLLNLTYPTLQCTADVGQCHAGGMATRQPSARCVHLSICL